MKLRLPIDLMLTEEVLSNDELRITLSAHANTDTNQVSLSIDLPPGLAPVGNPEKWEGAIEEGETKKISVIVLGEKDVSYTITGKAVVRLEAGGEVFQQRAQLILNKAESQGVQPRKPIRHKGNQGTVLEFR
ncbi:MAG: hypothetical protein ACE5FY_01890 [Nitrospiria bacterium]